MSTVADTELEKFVTETHWTAHRKPTQSKRRKLLGREATVLTTANLSAS